MNISIKNLATILLVTFFHIATVSGQSISTSSNGSNTSYVYKDNNQKLKIEYNGTIKISADGKSVSSVSPGSQLKIEKTTFGNSRAIVIKNDGNGLKHEYKEGGRNKAFEPDGRVWLAEILPEIMNSTTLGAEERVASHYSKGGASAVLELIDQLKGDYLKSTYLGLLLKKNLNATDISACIDKTMSEIDSDHYQLEVYKKIDPSYFKNVSQLNKVVSALDSDHFKTELLKPIFKTNIMEGKGKESIQLIKMVDSDHFKTEIAKTITFSSLSNQELKFMVDELVPAIDSDHFKNELLKTAFDKGNMDEGRSLIILDGVESIESDHFKSELLTYVCKKQGSEKVKTKIMEIAKNSIESSHFLGEVARCAS
jgi:hypothetical protein